MSTTTQDVSFDYLGATALILLEDGAHQAAALLRDAQSWRYTEARWEGSYVVLLDVPYWLIPRFTDEVREQIKVAWNEADREDHVSDVWPQRILPSTEGWRERLDREINQPAPTNQARLAPRGPDPIIQDGLYFRSQAELTVYRELQGMQEALAGTEPQSLAVLVNTSVRVPNHTWETDFIVCYRGRVGVLEVDGATHRGRAATDRTRDQVLEDAGMAYVTRVPVDAILEPAELRGHLDRFLRRLGGE